MVYFSPMDVKALREKLGLTQEQMSRELDVSFKTVNRWERGRSKPSRMAQRLLVELEKKKLGGGKGD